MVNKFVYNATTSSLAAVSGRGGPGSRWLPRALKFAVIAVAVGASLLGMSLAANAAASSSHVQPR